MSTDLPRFRPLTGVYEPSAIQQLPDGRFLVVEDEKEQPFCLVTLAPGGEVSAVPLEAAEAGKLADLEGLAADAAGWVYAITSHSRDGDGDEKKSREKLVRFRVEAGRAVAVQVVTGLKGALAAAYPALAAAAAVADVKGGGGLNVEALEVSGDSLLLGFRSPLVAGRAVVARVDNLGAMFAAGEPPRVAASLAMLDLGGHGLRGMGHVPDLGGHLLVSGPVAKEQVQFRLWFWSGAAGAPPRPVTVPGLAGFEHAEGVCPAIVGGRPAIVLVSDDGDREQGRYARYLVLDPQQLRIAP